jgi:hypothetical protein
LKEKTGIVYELHIIAEAGANGSILSLESDMTLHDRCDADTHELHLPMAYVTDFFKYHYMPNSKVGYMMNHPGDYSGKMANFVSFFIINPGSIRANSTNRWRDETSDFLQICTVGQELLCNKNPQRTF